MMMIKLVFTDGYSEYTCVNTTFLQEHNSTSSAAAYNQSVEFYADVSTSIDASPTVPRCAAKMKIPGIRLSADFKISPTIALQEENLVVEGIEEILRNIARESCALFLHIS